MTDTPTSDLSTYKRPDVPRYFRFACHFWYDEMVRAWPDQMKLFWLYLLTCKHRTLEGFFVLPPQYAAADMRWPLRRVKEMLAKLEQAERIRFDQKTSLLLIRNALRYQQPESQNVLKAIVSRVRSLPDNPQMLYEFIQLARLHCLRSGVPAQAQALPPLLEREFNVRPETVVSSNGIEFPTGTGTRLALERA